MTTFGEINWNDDVGGGGEKKNNKDLFLRLNEEPSNEMRIVTAPYQYLVHKVKKDPTNPKDFGQKVKCSAIHGSCPVCATGDKAKRRWLLGVISRKTGTYKVLDISWSVFSSIQKLAKSARWGDPTKYDIDIVVDKNGGATGYYSVQPIGKEPLSAADQQIKDNADLDYLKKQVTPPTPEQVQEKLDKILGTSGATPTADPSKKGKGTKVAPVSTEDDLDESFPSYDDSAQAE